MGNVLVSMVGALPPLKGNAYYCMNLAREMSKKVYVDFIAFRKLYPEFLYPGGTNEDDEKFRISETSSLSIRRIITYYNPISWIQAGMAARADIVHIQWWSIPIAPIYLALLVVLKMRGKKIIFTVHNVVPHESNPLDKILTKAVLSFGDRYIVHSNINRDNLIQNFGLSEYAVHQVHMPIHDMYVNEVRDRKNLRELIGIPVDAKVILSFGNLREYKGIDQLLSAFSQIIRTIPMVHLLVVGQPWVNWENYAQIITDLNIEKNVTAVLEYVPMSEVQKYFIASDLLALPYKKFDAQSGVGNIGLAFGLPLVVSRVGGLPDLVKDERAIVEPNNAKSLAEAITTIFLDEILYEKLREDTSVLKRQYSWRGAIESTFSIYEQILSEGH